MDKRYRKVVKFNIEKCEWCGEYIEFVKEIYNVDSMVEVLDDDELKCWRECGSGREYSIEEVKEGINNRSVYFIDEGEEVDEVGNGSLFILGVKVDNFDVNKWLRKNNYLNVEVEDMFMIMNG